MAEGLASRTEERDRSLEVAAVGHHAGHDEAPLDENFPVHALLSQRIPKCEDSLVPTERPLAVGDHRMLVERAGEVMESPQLASCFAPAAEPVEREAVELSNRPNVRCQPGEHAQLCERLPVPVALVGPGRDPKSSLQPRRAIGTDSSPQLLADLERQLVVLSSSANAALALRFAILSRLLALARPSSRPGRHALLRAIPRSRTAGATLSRGTARIGHNLERYPASGATMPTRFSRWALSEMNSGDDLLSQGVSPQVPSAQAGLTSVFGMGTGVTLPL